MDRSQIAFKTAALIRDIYSRSSHQIASGMMGSGLSHQQIMVIRLLAHKKTQQVSSLCQEMSLTKGTVSGIINRMEQAGYVEKYKDASDSDKRNTYIRLTQKGLDFSMVSKDKIIESYNHVFSNFSDEELAQLASLLQVLSDKLMDTETK